MTEQHDASNEGSVCLSRRTGECKCWAQAEPLRDWGAPQLAWAEPDLPAMVVPRPKNEPFSAWQKGKPTWPEGIPLAEIRLYWSGKALHLVKQRGETWRWSSLEEVEGEANTRRLTQSVHLLVDRARFNGLRLAEGELKVIEYRAIDREELLGWRLENA